MAKGNRVSDRAAEGQIHIFIMTSIISMMVKPSWTNYLLNVPSPNIITMTNFNMHFGGNKYSNHRRNIV
jgi:hypothetical protein